MAATALRADSAPVPPIDLCHVGICGFEEIAVQLDHAQAIVGLLALTEDNRSEMSAALRGVRTLIASAQEFAEGRAQYFVAEAK